MSLSRRQFVKYSGISAASLSLGALLSACSGAASSSAGSSASTDASTVIVSMTTSSEPASGFDPLYAWGCGEHVHEPLIQSTLITTDVDLNFVNDLATGYSCSEDGLTWTFTIRDDVKFTDGEPLTAEDVAFTINGINANEAAQADLSMIDEAVAIDPTTVELHLNKPYNAMLYTLAVVGIVPKHAYDAATYGSNPIGSGRYMLMEESASLAAAQSGTVDVAYTAATLVDSADPSEYSVLNCASVDSRGISLPSVEAGSPVVVDGDMAFMAGNPVTADTALRRAINMGVNREAMIDNVLNGYGTVAYSVSDGMPWYNPAMEVAYDREAALSELALGGWQPGEIGIEVIPVGGGWTYDDSGIYAHQYSDPVLWGWGANTPIQMYSLHYGPSSQNYSQYKNDAIDAHMDAALSYPEWQASQWDGKGGFAPQGAATWVWLCNVDHLYFKRDGLVVAEQKPHPHGHGWSLVNNVDRWRWE